jgi:hypothetical protein
MKTVMKYRNKMEINIKESNSKIYEVEIDFLGDLPEKLNLPRLKVAELMADEFMTILGFQK